MFVVYIEGKKITRKSEPYCIAEASLNHNGQLKLAYQMIEVAKESGADAIKFQTYKAKEFCNKDAELFKMFKKCEFHAGDWRAIKARCDSLGITFLSTPQNYSDLELLLKLDMKAVKVGSDDLTNLPLLRKFATSRLPIILSCGMAYQTEIQAAVNMIRNTDKDYPIILLHCTSLYPTMPNEANMKKLSELKGKYTQTLVGYSDHTVGHHASVLAVGLGAKVFETHFTLDNKMEGPDHSFSKSPEDLKDWIEAIREAHSMLGNGELIPTEREEQMRNVARRSLTAIVNIKKGEIFTENNIGLMRPSDGMPPSHFNLFIDSVSSRDIEAGEKLQRSDIEHETTSPTERTLAGSIEPQ